MQPARVLTSLASFLLLCSCATDTGSTQIIRYSDEKSEFTLDIEQAAERFSPTVYDCGAFTRNDYSGSRGNPHSIAVCVRNRARLGRPFRIFVCTSGLDFGYCRSTVIPGDGRMIVFYVEWSTDSTEIDAVECASYTVSPKTREMHTGTLSELQFLSGQSCQHSDELYELMVKRLPAEATSL